jgi:hypothetical protein
MADLTGEHVDILGMMEMSKTPLCDAAAERGSDHGLGNTMMSGIWPLARRLEESHARLVAALERIARLPDYSSLHTSDDLAVQIARAVLPDAKEIK